MHFFDTGFATNMAFSSQLLFTMMLMNKSYNVNTVYYRNLNLKHFTRSVLSAEHFSVVHGFDAFSTIRLTINYDFGRVVPLHFYTDWKSLFYYLTKSFRTSRKRLLIDRLMLRQSYECREVTEVFLDANPPESCRRFHQSQFMSALESFSKTNKISITPSAWVKQNAGT